MCLDVVHVWLCSKCMPGVHRAQKRTLHPKFWGWSYRLLETVIWVLKIEPKSPGSTLSTLY